MDTNRGAKGSIKDRIISLLYRIRYKMYLRKKNRKIVNNIKKNDYCVNEKYLKDNIDLFLEIPSKKIVNRKTETKSNIKNELYKAAYIFTNTVNLTLKLLEKDISNKSKIKIDNKNEVIRKKIERLNNYFIGNKNKYNIDNEKITVNLKILNNMDEFEGNDNKKKGLMLIKECKKEIEKEIYRLNEKQLNNDVVEKKDIINKESNKDNLNTNENNKSVTFEEPKTKENKLNDFEMHKREIYDIEKELKEKIEYHNKIVNELYEKSSKYNVILETKNIYPKLTNIVYSLLNILGGIITIPFKNKKKKLFGIFLINRGIKNLRRGIENNEIKNNKLEYEDISNKIKDVKNELEYTNILIEDSIRDIEIIKDKIAEEMQYNKSDYIINFFDKIIELEKKLNDEYYKLNKINKKLYESEQNNKNKIKKIEMLKK